MVWRPPYVTRELAPQPIPELSGKSLSGNDLHLGSVDVLLGAFDLRAQVELGVWHRLAAGIVPSIAPWTVYFFDSPSRKQSEDLRAMTPPSLWAFTFISTSGAAWRRLIKPDRPERSFGALIKNGIANPMMVGTPTETALDRFQESLGRLTKE